MRVASPVASLRFPLFTLLLMRHQLGPRGQRAPRLLWPRTGVASGKRCSLSAWAGVEPWGQLLLAVLLGMCSWGCAPGMGGGSGLETGALLLAPRGAALRSGSVCVPAGQVTVRLDQVAFGRWRNRLGPDCPP